MFEWQQNNDISKGMLFFESFFNMKNYPEKCKRKTIFKKIFYTFLTNKLRRFFTFQDIQATGSELTNSVIQDTQTATSRQNVRFLVATHRQKFYIKMFDFENRVNLLILTID